MHELLNKRKLQENEFLDEYFLIMKQLCAHGNIEDSALMQFFFNGIPHPVFRKSILYECQTNLELKQKLKIYDEIRTDYENTKSPKVKSHMSVKEKPYHPKIDFLCFSCSQANHNSSQCKYKDKGLFSSAQNLATNLSNVISLGWASLNRLIFLILLLTLL